MTPGRAAEGVRKAGVRRLAQSTAAVYRALASVPGGPLAGDIAGRDKAAWLMLLSEVPQHSHPGALARWRGRVDAMALRARYSDARRHARHQPGSQPAQMLFSLLEQIRVEVLGARQFAGVRLNLAALAQEKWIRARPEGVVRGAGSAWIETFALLTRLPLGAPLPEAAREALSLRWRSWMTSAEAQAVEALAVTVDDQDAFARAALLVIDAVLGPAPAESDESPWSSEPADEPEAESAAPHATRPADAHSQVTAASGDPMAYAELRDTGENAPRAAAAQVPAPQAYQVYTRAFDAVVFAGDLSDAVTLVARRRELDQRVGSHATAVMRWAHRLQRHLLALQMRSWQFDQEEGVLDASRLTRVVTHPLESLAYKQETEIEFPDTVVTLLVDNSGSMRGLPIAAAAVCAELLGRVLERCGVKTEILGFTTRSWRGGRARQQWLAAGRPRDPGRITELRHVIYKNADEPWRRARLRLGEMLDPELLKENIDGEALLWAHERLLLRAEPRRILLVISDGAPLDDATVEANDAGYLDRHLRAVIDAIERHGEVELAAIGIGHDVTSYYRRAMTLPGVDDLGEAIVAQLIELFDAPPGRLRRVAGPGTGPEPAATAMPSRKASWHLNSGAAL